MDEFVKSRIKQVRKGDQNAFGEIVELYKDKVFQLCFRMLGNSHEAEDISQEAFIRAYINIERYNIDRKFSTWLYRIATNLCIDRIRKKKPDYYLDAEVAGTEGLTLYSQIPASQLAPDEEVSKIELQEIIQNEILKLPEKYRAVIVLRYIEELPYWKLVRFWISPLELSKREYIEGEKLFANNSGIFE